METNVSKKEAAESEHLFQRVPAFKKVSSMTEVIAKSDTEKAN